MPRRREFDQDEVLDRALGLFWSHGYQSASMAELCSVMGIGRASLYAAFGSKRKLFLSALDRYERKIEEFVLEPLFAEGSPKKILKTLFEEAARRSTEPGAHVCLAVKTAVSDHEVDPDLDRFLDRMTERTDEAFSQVLRRARSLGELEPGRNLKRLARFLTNGLQSVALAAAMRRDPKAVLEIAREIVAAVG